MCGCACVCVGEVCVSAYRAVDSAVPTANVAE